MITSFQQSPHRVLPWTVPSLSIGHSSTPPQWHKKIDFPIVGVIFYGRRQYVSILDCYLQRNLKRNGGLLDEVIFVVRTDDQNDLDWLDHLLLTTHGYTKYTESKGRPGKSDFSDGWNFAQNGTVYIKIDDDVVFFEDDTINAMVKRKIDHPEYFLISANTLNQPAQAWVHYHLAGAVRPYLPELSPAGGFTPRANIDTPDYHDQDRPTWRASELPRWKGPENYTIDEGSPAPFVGHRWLPMGADADISDTPVSVVTYEMAGAGWHSWVVAAQMHYSFLDNLENDRLGSYKYDLWDYHYDRISIQLVLISGEDLLASMPMDEDDEGYLTTVMTRRLKRHAVMEGTGMAVHYGFGAQLMAHDWHGLRDTDVLDRYRAFAQERVCGKPRGSKMTGP